jgi:hypothetical protein
VRLPNVVSGIITGVIPKAESLVAWPRQVASILLAVAARLLTSHRSIIVQR